MALKYWSIGPIRGLYQPESFTESQEMNVTDQDPIGNVVLLGFKSWKPREVSISFVVYGDAYSGRTASDRNSFALDNWTDPEDVWKRILGMIRPERTEVPEPVDLTLPGWGTREYAPQKAIVVNASINRTHINRRGSAERATISVTLRELALGNKEDIQDKIEEFQFEEDAESFADIPGATPP